MKDKCFEIGTIQAYLDGEIAPDLSKKVIKHVALCDKCASMVSELEEESATVFAALESELNPLVPTERLRTKVFASIKEIEAESKVGWRERLGAQLAFIKEIDLRSPAFAAVAVTVLFVGTFAVALKVLPPMSGLEQVVVVNPSEIVQKAPQVEKIGGRDQEVSGADEVETSDDLKSDKRAAPKKIPTVYVPKNRNARPRVIKAGYRPTGASRKRKASRRKASVTPKANAPAILGEDVYISTIATLNRNVDANKDEVFRPKERIAFEKNLAMLNHTIKKMKAVVRKNPKNAAAKELLKTSYQNKIDLLNSVSERSELVASLD